MEEHKHKGRTPIVSKSPESMVDGRSQTWARGRPPESVAALQHERHVRAHRNRSSTLQACPLNVNPSNRKSARPIRQYELVGAGVADGAEAAKARSDLTSGRRPKRPLESPLLDVFIDESVFPDPACVIAGAVVLQNDRAAIDERIRSLYEELADLFFLEDERSFKKFLKQGFHATDDLQEVSAAFIKLISQYPGTKLFIEWSDHTSRPDLRNVELIALLDLRLVETILRKYRRVPHVRFTFEQNPELDRHFSAIVDAGCRRTGYTGTTTIEVGGKMDPPALSVVDYALVTFGRTLQDHPEQHQLRAWKAFRPLVSSIRNLDRGGVDLQRGLISGNVTRGEGTSS